MILLDRCERKHGKPLSITILFSRFPEVPDELLRAKSIRKHPTAPGRQEASFIFYKQRLEREIAYNYICNDCSTPVNTSTPIHA